MKVKVYVEGGGDTRDLKAQCRKAFSSFFGRANLAGRMPSVVACGGRERAYDRFITALRSAGKQEFVVLLVDSEAPVTAGSGPWTHLEERDGWDKPAGATDDHAHLMVQCMEAWFLADPGALAGYFDDGFRDGALPRRAEVEEVSKPDIERGLKAATRHCKPKGAYHKGRDSFRILEILNPGTVEKASPHAKRFLETLRARST